MGVQPLSSLCFFLLFPLPPLPMAFGAGVLGLEAAPACGLGRGGSCCLHSLALSCIQITAVPWLSCGDIPACPGDSPGVGGVGVGFGEPGRSGVTHPGGHRAVFHGWFFSGGFRVKPSPSQSGFPWQPPWPSRKWGAACSLGGGYLDPSCQPGSGCRLSVSQGLCCPAQMRPPPRSQRGLWTMPSSILHRQPMAKALLGLRQGFLGHLQPPEAL